MLDTPVNLVYNICLINGSFLWEFFMDRYAMMSREERSVVMREKLRLAREGIFMSLSELVSVGVCLSTPNVPIQLELPLEWNRHVTPEPLLKVSEPCTNQTQSQLLTKNK